VTRARRTVVIADDHQITRIGVRMALLDGGFAVVGEAGNRRGAVAAVLARRPDICLLDISMPGGGIAAAEEIAASGISTAIVMLTVSDRIEDVRAALSAGASGFLQKDMSPARLAAALDGVLDGEAAIPRAALGTLLPEMRELNRTVPAPMDLGGVHLTSREVAVLRLLRSGFSTREVGEMLSLSPVTIRRHVSAGMTKLGVSDRESAIEAIGRRRAG
jgi:two-component system, NarL family, nitrate/nitrite response regulator NarL